jgi:hypothetical protein
MSTIGISPAARRKHSDEVRSCPRKQIVGKTQTPAARGKLPLLCVIVVAAAISGTRLDTSAGIESCPRPVLLKAMGINM